MYFTCPHCQIVQTVTSYKISKSFAYVNVADHALGKVGLRVVATGCANPECKQLTVDVELVSAQHSPRGMAPDSRKVHHELRLIPFGSAKPLPDYIPVALREDYTEACLIRALSPKASATLIRRCLQGMIRDFCGVSEKTLCPSSNDLEQVA